MNWELVFQAVQALGLADRMEDWAPIESESPAYVHCRDRKTPRDYRLAGEVSLRERLSLATSPIANAAGV